MCDTYKAVSAVADNRLGLASHIRNEPGFNTPKKNWAAAGGAGSETSVTEKQGRQPQTDHAYAPVDPHVPATCMSASVSVTAQIVSSSIMTVVFSTDFSVRSSGFEHAYIVIAYILWPI